MKIKKTKISGCYEIIPLIHQDERGLFVKTFHEEVFSKNNLSNEFAEEYYSVSKQGVLRGLHFQTPPKEHVKLVYCVSGEVLDVVVDLRYDSPTYGQFEMFNLTSELTNTLYIPKGLAHGFYVLSKEAILIYKVTTVYSKENDSGILWSSVGIPWPNSNPIISQRDNTFISFDEFNSPFRYEGK